MRRGVQGERIVYDDHSVLAVLCTTILLILGILLMLDEQPNPVPLVIGLSFAAYTAVARHRTVIDRAGDRLRVLWVLALTPSSRGIELRVHTDLPLSVFIEVLISRTEDEGGQGIFLVYKDPHRRYEFELAQIGVGVPHGFYSARDVAEPFAKDVGLPLRES